MKRREIKNLISNMDARHVPFLTFATDITNKLSELLLFYIEGILMVLYYFYIVHPNGLWTS